MKLYDVATSCVYGFNFKSKHIDYLKISDFMCQPLNICKKIHLTEEDWSILFRFI